jgi:hypothetical protein
LFTRNELQKIIIENSEFNSREFANLHLKLKGVKIAKRTVNTYLSEWNVERVPKDEYYRNIIIRLRIRGWSLKEIWVNVEEGLVFTKNSWNKNRWRFFKRVFEDDTIVKNKEGGITKKIVQAYKPVEAKKLKLIKY